MPLFREVGGPRFAPAGRHRKPLTADFIDGSKPSWLIEVPGTGVLSYTSLSATSPGTAVVTNAGTTPAGWQGPEFDLAAPWLRSVEFTARNLRLGRASNGAHLVVDFGIRSLPTEVAGARLFTRFTPPSWAVIECLSGGGAVGAQEVRMPFGPRASGTALMLQGDSPRDLTFHIDTRDKTVSLLMADQVIYSRQRSDLVLGPVRPYLVMARAGSTTGDRTMSVTGLEVAFEINGS